MSNIPARDLKAAYNVKMEAVKAELERKREEVASLHDIMSRMMIAGDFEALEGETINITVHDGDGVRQTLYFWKTRCNENHPLRVVDWNSQSVGWMKVTLRFNKQFDY